MAGNLRLLAGVVGLAGLSSVLVFYAGVMAARPIPALTRFEVVTDAAAAPAKNAVDDAPDESTYTFRPPSGQAASLSCEDARRIVRQVRATLAYAPPSVAPERLANGTADWLDPYGLWSEAPDSPIPEALERHAKGLVLELESDDGAPCATTDHLGVALLRWSDELGARFDEARRAAAAAKASVGTTKASAVNTAAGDAMFDDEALPARAVATSLGEHGGRLEHALGESASAYVDAARARFFPRIDGEQWGAIVRAAAVRAYVQALDPHGAWAPRGEEASVYDVDLDAHPPDRLWDQAVRTAVGVRIESGPMDPLEVGDVLLSIAGVSTVGLPPEQLDQLVYATTDNPISAPLVILRHDERELRTLQLPAPEGAQGGSVPSSEPVAALPSYRIRYGAGDALVVEIHDVRSDLGDELAATVQKQLKADSRPVRGLLLDLRDDGGGSTEGAIAAIGMFVPGAPLFPMARRSGFIEVDRAPEPPVTDRWMRPVASLVDGDTASAAEMIAGALAAYRRGPVVGRPTYGKGCAQEYLDDDARVGVLRLTTLLYALPDGAPVQRVGLEPSLLLLPPVQTGDTSEPPPEHEADAPNAPPTWRGPDVRDRSLVLPAADTAWPEHGGAVGPCRSKGVCEALQALGGSGQGKRPSTAEAPSVSGRR